MNLENRVVDRLGRNIANEIGKARVWRRISTDPYQAIARLASRYGYTALSAAEVRVFSQNGEDGVLAEIFSRIGTTNQFFVEFGVQDGLQCNTRFLMEVLGWSGVYFEPNPQTFSRLADRLANRADVLTFQETVTPENANAVFARVGVPTEPDLLSIDIDGQDYWVWEALDDYRPRVVIIEYNSKLPAEARLVETKGLAWEGVTPFYGASLGALSALGDRMGYSLVHAELAGVNLFFVRKDVAQPFEIPPLRRGPNYFLRGESLPLSQRGHVDV